MADDSGPVELSVAHVGMAAFLLLMNGGVSLYLELDLERRLLVGAMRAFVQLMLLGYLLVPIFRANNPVLTTVYALFMASVATWEAQRRSKYGYREMLGHTMVALAGSSSLVLTYALGIVIAVKPWWEAQYLIPIFGMLLGNTTNGISIGLSTTLTELAEGRPHIESLLAMGATRWEACRGVMQKAITLGLTPVVNQMSIIGMVAIPGMMTGQILGGTPPEQAARYQCIIIFLIAATTCLGTVAASVLAVHSITDAHHRVRAERLLRYDEMEAERRRKLKLWYEQHISPVVQPRYEAAKYWITSRPLVQDALHRYKTMNSVDMADL